MIHNAKTSIAFAINTSQTMLYWQIGGRILKEILKNERAEYGQQIVVTVSRQLVI